MTLPTDAAEVELKKLPTGAEFNLLLDSTGRRRPGYLLTWNECSALVMLLDRVERVIRTSEGKEIPVTSVTGYQRWSAQTLVIPTGGVVPREEVDRVLNSIYKGETVMAKEKKEKAAKKAKEPKVRVFEVIKYEPAAKASTDKGKELAGKPSHNGVLLAAIVKKGPLTFAELMDAVPAKAFGSASKNVESIYRWHVSDLMKKGFIKSVGEKVEATSAAEARTGEAAPA